MSRTDGRIVRRDDTKADILEVALELFAARGVTATTMDDIAAVAGVAKGSIYYNFGSKDQLVSQLLRHHAQRLVASLEQAATMPGESGRIAIIRSLLEHMRRHPAIAKLMVAEMFRTDRKWLDVVQSWREQFTHALVENLVAEMGEDKRQWCRLRAAALIGATLTGGLQWLLDAVEMDINQVAATVLGLEPCSHSDTAISPV